MPTRSRGSACICASALQYLHGRGVLHLDVKPSNVIASAGRAVLIDLSLRGRRPLPAGLGTWCYLAPEQARGDELTAAADVWGLGTVLFEAATGRPAFEDDEAEATTGRPTTRSTPASRSCSGPAPPATGALAGAIGACLAFDPSTARPARAGHMRSARTRPAPTPGVA